MNTLNIDSDKAEEMILAQQNIRSKNNSIAIRLHLKLIQELQSKGYTRKAIYNFLKEQKVISCRYETFCNSLKSICSSQKNREQVSVSTKQPVKKTVVSSTKTQFFEHNSSPSAELIASLTGETDD